MKIIPNLLISLFYLISLGGNLYLIFYGWNQESNSVLDKLFIMMFALSNLIAVIFAGEYVKEKHEEKELADFKKEIEELNKQSIQEKDQNK